MINLKSQREYTLLKESATILKEVFDSLQGFCEPGIRTIDIDRKVEALIRKKNALPAFKNYNGFPASICVSINEEVVHGIPSERVLCDGDIVSIDIGVKVQGYYADAARTYPVGTVSENAQQLITVTRASLFYALEHIRTGMHLGNLSHAVQSFVERNNFSVVREYVGHGIGQELHEDPQVPNFGKPGAGVIIQEGLCLAIEPMVNERDWRTELLDNKWTVVTKDRKLSAHHEETIFFGAENPEILTA